MASDDESPLPKTSRRKSLIGNLASLTKVLTSVQCAHEASLATSRHGGSPAPCLFSSGHHWSASWLMG